MRIALDGRAAFNLTFQLAEASKELMVESTFCEQIVLAPLERLLGECKFFQERSDQGLGVARKLSLKLFDLILKTCDETKDSLRSLIIESENG
jgi:hypothetical protein